jgi:hypothetical protein
VDAVWSMKGLFVNELAAYAWLLNIENGEQVGGRDVVCVCSADTETHRGT